ncbi:MAG: 2-oxoacid:ferredoxin oxidoreductase subunit gamma [Planctomycetes bacterium]|nr:2-oxoacid:ferredoxin oxidoreductase subunit gamma [Planctomycetota bacterium]
MDERMIFSGFGGQGLMTLGKFVAELLMRRHQVTFFPSYGTEVRGGTAYCHVCAADRPIASPAVEHATCLVVMNQMSYDRFAPLVRPDGLVLSNSGMVRPDGSHGRARLVEIDASGLANRLGDVRVANMVMLGALLALKPLASEKDAAALLEKKLGAEPGKREILDLNKKALRTGLDEAGRLASARA